MLLFYMVFFVGEIFINGEEVDPRVSELACQSFPDERCLLKNDAVTICPNQARWAFDAETKTCEKIYWGDHCGTPEEGVNIFTSERRCYNDCLGISKRANEPAGHR